MVGKHIEASTPLTFMSRTRSCTSKHPGRSSEKAPGLKPHSSRGQPTVAAMPNGVETAWPWKTHWSIPSGVRTILGAWSRYLAGRCRSYMSGGSIEWSSMLTRIMSSMRMGSSLLLLVLPPAASSADPVEGDGALGGDHALLLEAEAVEGLAQLLGHAGELGVGVRVVAGPDDAIGTDEGRLGGGLQHGLVRVEADPALPTEVLRGEQRQVRHLPLELAAVMVEALEPRHEPAAIGLQEDELGPGEPLAHPACQQVGDAAHDVDRVGEGLGEQRRRAVLGMSQLLVLGDGAIRIEVLHVASVGAPGTGQAQALAGPGEVRGQERVEGDGQPRVRGSLPDGVVDRVVERAPVDGRVGAHEDRH